MRAIAVRGEVGGRIETQSAVGSEVIARATGATGGGPEGNS
jgi:hypothetical protein